MAKKSKTKKVETMVADHLSRLELSQGEGTLATLIEDSSKEGVLKECGDYKLHGMWTS